MNLEYASYYYTFEERLDATLESSLEYASYYYTFQERLDSTLELDLEYASFYYTFQERLDSCPRYDFDDLNDSDCDIVFGSEEEEDGLIVIGNELERVCYCHCQRCCDCWTYILEDPKAGQAAVASSPPPLLLPAPPTLLLLEAGTDAAPTTRTDAAPVQEEGVEVQAKGRLHLFALLSKSLKVGYEFVKSCWDRLW
jgi:hypothetical protein